MSTLEYSNKLVDDVDNLHVCHAVNPPHNSKSTAPENIVFESKLVLGCSVHHTAYDSGGEMREEHVCS